MAVPRLEIGEAGPADVLRVRLRNQLLAGRLAHLLPDFDEFFVAYRVRARRELSAALVIDGRIGPPRTAAERRAVAAARARYAAYKR